MKYVFPVVVVVAIALVAGAFYYGILDFRPPQQPPAFSVTLTKTVTNLTAQFNTTVVGGVGPFSYIWDLGDNSTRITSVGTVTYTYAVAGTYAVSVLVRGTDDRVVEARTTVMVA